MRDGSKVCGTYVTYVNPTLSGRGFQSEIRPGSVIQLIGLREKSQENPMILMGKSGWSPVSPFSHESRQPRKCDLSKFPQNTASPRLLSCSSNTGAKAWTKDARPCLPGSPRWWRVNKTWETRSKLGPGSWLQVQVQVD